MDASQSALDSLRTVEFRETLKGYHRDDVDEYLERAAIEAEGLQEQLRQSGERLRQAAERITELEAELKRAPELQQPEPSVQDDTLQRTLLLAQKFVDETKADSEAQAAQILADADAKARLVTEQAQAKATQIAADSEQRLRDEIARLEGTRTKLAHDIEAMSRHVESERARLRHALSEILKWVDDNVSPAPTEIDLRGRPSTPAGPTAAPAEGAGQPPAPGGERTTAADEHGSSSGSEPTGAMTEVHPGAATGRPATTNAPLPL